MSRPLASVGTFKKRLKEATLNKQLHGAAAESYIFETTDLSSLCQEDRKRLQWICEKIVWPVTRKKVRRDVNPTPRMFDDERGRYG